LYLAVGVGGGERGEELLTISRAIRQMYLPPTLLISPCHLILGTLGAGRYTCSSSQRISKIQIRFSGCTGG